MSVLEVIEEVKSLNLAEQQEFWQKLSEIEFELQEVPESNTDVFSLQRVAPKRSYQIKVKYNFIGKGQPKPFPLAEEN